MAFNFELEDLGRAFLENGESQVNSQGPRLSFPLSMGATNALFHLMALCGALWEPCRYNKDLEWTYLSG